MVSSLEAEDRVLSSTNMKRGRESGEATTGQSERPSFLHRDASVPLKESGGGEGGSGIGGCCLGRCRPICLSRSPPCIWPPSRNIKTLPFRPG